MRKSVVAGALVSLLAFPAMAEAKTCERECKTSRTVSGNGALQWKTSQTFASDDQVLVTVYIDGHDVPGTAPAHNVTAYTRGQRTVSVITRARRSRIEVRASNFARSSARVTVKFKQIR